MVSLKASFIFLLVAGAALSEEALERSERAAGGGIIMGLNLFEGDIQGYKPTRSAVREKSFLWNTRVIPYTIDSSIDTEGKEDIAGAIQEYDAKTCIRWVPRTTEEHFVTFKQEMGCYSIIGRAGGQQVVSLNKACSRRGTAIHEMMHALGFWHEQSRPDRDPWVQVIYGNIQEGMEFNFEKLSTSQVDTLGVPYDYGSIMHYSRYAFTRNGEPTILPVRDPGAFLGQREALSAKDILRINKLYRCDVTIPTQDRTTAMPVPTTQPTTQRPTPFTPSKPKTLPTTTRTFPTTQRTTSTSSTTFPTTRTTFPTTPSSTPTTRRTIPTTQRTVSTSQKPLPTTQKTVPTTPQPAQTTKVFTTVGPIHTTPRLIQTTAKPSVPVPTMTSPIAVTIPPVTTVSTSSKATTRPAPVTLFPPLGWTPWGEYGACDFSCKRSRHRFCMNFDPRYCPGPDVEVQMCHLPCRVTYTFGCWKNDPLHSAMASNEGLYPDLLDDYRTRTDAIRKCGDVAALQEHETFALADGGKCVSGLDALSTFSTQGASSECRDGRGGPHSSTVYSFINNMDGAWSLWTGWSQCTRTCSGGQRFRFRYCNNPPAIGDGKLCEGASTESETCNSQPCTDEDVCGIKYHTGEWGTSGYIAISNYSNFMTCEYVITTGRPDATLSLDIERLDVEYSTSCSYDALLVFDGPNETAPLAGIYCGSGRPATIQSSSNQLFLRFQSDATTTGKGFTIAYSINPGRYKACSQPPLMAHGAVMVDGNSVGHHVSYNCDPGFHLIGSSRITCLDQPGKAVWSDKFPLCLSDFKRSLTAPRNHEVCTFQDNMCGYQGDVKATYKWVVRTFNEADADEVDAKDGFLFVEATPTWRWDDVARVVSPSYQATPSGRCLFFRYRADAFSGALRVLMRLSSQDDVTTLWTSPGNVEQGWQQEVVQIRPDKDFEIIFEAAIGERFGSWVAVDDVIISRQSC